MPNLFLFALLALDNKPPTPMDTVEKDETDETEQDQTMADATPETEKAAPDKGVTRSRIFIFIIGHNLS